jgi:hypothetical protein
MSDADASAANGEAMPFAGQPYTLAYRLHAGGIGLIALCRKPGLDDNPMWQRSFKLVALLSQLPPPHAFGDWYLSLNAFSRPGRRLKHLASLRGSFVDLDTYSAARWADRPPEETWAAVRQRLVTLGLAVPQMAIFSGRGLQLVWVYPKGLPPAALPRWRAVQKHHADALSGFAPDYAALDAARIVRLPGTINSKSQQPARFLHLDIEGATDFEALAARALPLDRFVLRQRRQHDRDRPTRAGTPRRGAQARYVGTLLADVGRLIDHRWGGRIPVHHRNTTLFVYGCFLVRLVGVVALPEALVAFGTRACDLDESEMEQIARSITRKIAADGVGYRFTAAGAAMWLDVSVDEVRAAKLVRLHPEDPELLAARREARRRQDRDQKRDKRRAAGSRPRSESLAQTRPWVDLKILKSTWYRRNRHGVTKLYRSETKV